MHTSVYCPEARLDVIFIGGTYCHSLVYMVVFGHRVYSMISEVSSNSDDFVIL